MPPPSGGTAEPSSVISPTLAAAAGCGDASDVTLSCASASITRPFNPADESTGSSINLLYALSDDDHESTDGDSNTNPPSSTPTQTTQTFCEDVISIAKSIKKKLSEGKSLTKANKIIINNSLEKLITLTNQYSTPKGPFPQPAAVTHITTPPNPTYLSEIKRTIREEIQKQLQPSSTLRPTPPPIIPQYSRAYADAAKTPKQHNTHPLPISKPSIVVSAKPQVQSSAETMQHFTQSVSFRNTKFSPANIKYISNNKVRMEFDTIEQRETTLQKINSTNSTVTAQPTKNLSPSILLKGINLSTPAEDLVDIIFNQNEFINNATSKTDIIFKAKKNNKNKNLYNAILMVTPSCWRAAIGAGRINIEHQRIHVENYIPLLHCFSCMQFGHIRKHCTQNVTICSHCASTQHSYKECPSKTKPPICHNCSKDGRGSATGHSATSHFCPKVINMMDIVHNKIDYGQ